MERSLSLELTTMAHGGAALGRHEGKVIFVPYALPGETVRVQVTDDQGRYAHAELLEVLTPSPDRVPPPCPYFGPQACGGCQWQHAAPEAQLRYKAQVVADQLRRIGRFADPPVEPTVPDAAGWAYRNRARLRPASGGGLGFLSADSHQVVAIDACLVIHPLLSEMVDALDLDVPDLKALVLRAGVATGDQMLIFEMEGDEPPAIVLDMPASCVILLSDGLHANLVGHNHITEKVAGHTYRISAPSFFQSNTRQAEQLVRLVLSYLDLQGGEVVVDGYCGVGLFTLPLAERAGLVLAVEEDPTTVEDLLANTADADNVEVVEGLVEAVLSDLEGPIDAVVVDPPRTGLAREAVDALVADGPSRIVYVSCDPATLARDGRQLARADYHLEAVQPVDMFPQTYHIETVSLWVRRA
jgi:23S rRNA (uracil1939-C5)-methyltransferase